MRNTTIKISKLDAARRQLDTAIDLYFDSGDPVSIHSLSAAAFEVLRSLSGSPESFLTTYDQIVEHAKKLGFEKEIIKALNKSQNFFKHADRDPDDILDFRIEATIFIMYESTRLYQHFTSELPLNFEILRGWLILRYPEIHRDNSHNEAVKNAASEYKENERLKFKLDYIHSKTLLKKG